MPVLLNKSENSIQKALVVRKTSSNSLSLQWHGDLQARECVDCTPTPQVTSVSLWYIQEPHSGNAKSYSWPYMIDARPFRSMPIGHVIPEIRLFQAWVWSKGSGTYSVQRALGLLSFHFTSPRPIISEIQLFQSLSFKNPRSRSWVLSKFDLTPNRCTCVSLHANRSTINEIWPTEYLTLKNISGILGKINITFLTAIRQNSIKQDACPGDKAIHFPKVGRFIVWTSIVLFSATAVSLNTEGDSGYFAFKRSLCLTQYATVKAKRSAPRWLRIKSRHCLELLCCLNMKYPVV